jgi:hypothetical protein
MMSTSRVLSRFAVVAAGLVLATVGLAVPANAADTIEVKLGGVNSSMTAGSRSDSFSATFRNNSNNTLDVRIFLAVKLNGLTNDQVRIVRAPGSELPHQESGGQIVFNDPATIAFLPHGGPRTVTYTIQFISGAPSGRATLTAEAAQGTNPVGSDNKTISVKGAPATGAGRSATPTPTASSAATNPGGTAAGGQPVVTPTVSLHQKEGILAADSGGVGPGLYIIGALLVGVGGVILWLLFRRSKGIGREYAGGAPVGGFPTGGYDSVPPSLGYPTGRAPMHANTQPTTHMPNLRAATVPSPLVANSPARHASVDNVPPPVDPWASQAGGAHDAITRTPADPPPTH